MLQGNNPIWNKVFKRSKHHVHPLCDSHYFLFLDLDGVHSGVSTTSPFRILIMDFHPCPFCGNENVHTKVLLIGACVHCPSCKAHGPVVPDAPTTMETLRNARRAWDGPEPIAEPPQAPDTTLEVLAETTGVTTFDVWFTALVLALFGGAFLLILLER